MPVKWVSSSIQGNNGPPALYLYENAHILQEKLEDFLSGISKMSYRPVVLVADDEKVCLIVATKLLEHLGLRAIHAHDGNEAVSLYRQYREEIVCVLLDINMPNMNGVETFNRLKEIDDDVKVIIVSGYVTKNNMKLLEPNNPVGYIEKPLDYVRLSGHLKKITAI